MLPEAGFLMLLKKQNQMTKTIHTSLAVLMLGISLFSSCKKDEESSPAPTPTNTTPTVNTTPNITGAEGVLVGVQTKMIQTVAGISIPYYTGSGVASFWTSAGSYLDAGAITLNTNSLTKNSSNAYYFTPGASSPTGIDFSSNSYNCDWVVAGNSGNGIPAINRTITMGFPDLDSIQSSSTISLGSSFTLQCPSVSNADSVMFFVAGQNATLMYIGAPGTNSHTFSSSEMSTLGTGTGILEIVPYRYEMHVESGKNIFYVNETAVVKTVTFN